jgi:DNA polymerase-3 subunit gamma/tau
VAAARAAAAGQAAQPPEAQQTEAQASVAEQQPEAAQQKPVAAPPSSAKPATAQPPRPATGKAVTQTDINQNWARIRQMVKKNHGRAGSMLEGLLNSARSMTIKGDILVLGFSSDMLKSKVETEENIAILCQVLQTVLGASLGVRCVVVGNKPAQATDLDVDGDGMVGTALDLGGEIIFEE